MAGIGFALRKMTQQNNLLGVIQAYSLSALLSTGPWLFTIIAIAFLAMMAQRIPDQAGEMMLFRVIITYNFSFSLVLSGPIVIVATRFLSDQIYAKDVSGAPGMLVCALGLYFLVAVIPGSYFYGVTANMTTFQRLGAISGLFLIGFIWIATIFISALKDYKSVAIIFGAGMLVAGTSCLLLGSPYGAAGMIHGFNIGLALIFFALIARILSEYQFDIIRPLDLIFRFKPYWVLAMSGLTYNAAIWVDKWLMWFLEPGAEVVGDVLFTLPFYDSAMFLAYLITIPATALFFVSVETEFFERYQRFYSSFAAHATLTKIKEYQQAITDFVYFSFRKTTIFVGCLAILAAISASAWFDNFGIPYQQIGVYRLGTIGAAFHILFLFALIFLSYFDQRKVVLGLNILFLITNALFTFVSLKLGFKYYGFGYTSATALCFLMSFILLAHRLKWLLYQAFVSNNPSISK
jgi:uncharacterized membrane protein